VVRTLAKSKLRNAGSARLRPVVETPGGYVGQAGNGQCRAEKNLTQSRKAAKVKLERIFKKGFDVSSAEPFRLPTNTQPTIFTISPPLSG
jgi:hypothetical protein